MRKVIPKSAVLIPDQAKRVFKGVIYDVYQWEQSNFDDSVATFEMLKRPDTVAVICISDGKIMILHDEQPHRGLKLSLPGGRVDDTDDSILSAAKREVQEETGHSFKHWKLISVAQPFQKMEWFVHTYVAWEELHKGDVHHDAGEKIEQELITFEKFRDLTLKGEGSMGESRHIVEHLANVDELKQLPEYQGITVDR